MALNSSGKFNFGNPAAASQKSQTLIQNNDGEWQVSENLKPAKC